MKYKLFAGMLCVVLLTGCTDNGSSKGFTTNGFLGGGPSSEKLLNAEGLYRLVEINHAADPEQRHADTRKQVSPNGLASSRYTDSANQVRVAETIHTRTLRLEREVETAAGEFKGLKDTLQLAAMSIPLPDTKPHAPQARARALLTAAVTNLRIGEHAGKTRLVLDTDTPAEFAYDIDNERNLLLITLPSAHWSAPQKQVLNGKRVAAYAAKTAEDGAMVAVKLQGPAKVLKSESLGKDAQGHYRIYFDISQL